jgi:hypothetical protein
MTKHHAELKRETRQRLMRYVGMMQKHCGREPDRTLAVQEGEQFLEWLDVQFLAERQGGRNEVNQ